MKNFNTALNYLILTIVIFVSCEKDESPREEVVPDDVKVTSLDVSAEAQSLLKGTTTQLSVTVLPSNADNKSVIWSSSDEAIATVSATGLVTAIGVGTVTMTATSEENTSLSDAIEIGVEGSNSNDIISFLINGNIGDIEGKTITFEFLEGTDVSSLRPVITHNGISISPENQTEIDFSNKVIFNVTSENGDIQEWEVLINFKAIPASGSEFITTWKTDNPGASDDNQITIPTAPWESYNYTVDWGDGNTDSGVTGNITHTYDAPGTYQVAIIGDFPGIYFSNPFNNSLGDDDKILSIDQWGTNKWRLMTNAFAGCDNLDMKAYDIPDFSLGLATNFMFAACPSLIGNTSMNFWEMSTVTNMNLMFQKCVLFNQDISSWDVSNSDGLNGMFFECTSFNQDLSSWKVENVENFGSMFSHASSFNQDIGNWDVSKATNMNGMFIGASSFNQDISGWKVNQVGDMTLMFAQAAAFNQNLSAWDIGQVLHMSGMFNDTALSKENYDVILEGWNELPVLQSGIYFGAENVNYCESGLARQNLIDTYGWSITDGGKDCN